jgi:hypothetical protein
MFTVTWLCCVVVTVMLLPLIALIVPIVIWRPVPPPGKVPLGLVVLLPFPGVVRVGGCPCITMIEVAFTLPLLSGLPLMVTKSP